jgi:hypothetical protein
MPEIEFYETKKQCENVVKKLKPSWFLIDYHTNRHWAIEWYINYIK